MNGYLMDTNHVTAWEAQSPALIAKLNSLPNNTLVFTSAITLREISAGHEMTTPGDAQRRHLVKQFLNLYVIPYAVSITHATESYYGQIIGRIWKGTPPPRASTPTDAHLVSLGVNINDVWIVACAADNGPNSFVVKILTSKPSAIKILQTLFARPAPSKPFQSMGVGGYLQSR